jgi:phosphatidylglycerol lysyltransferase
MKRLLHRLAPILILAVTAGCCWLLYKQLREYRWRDIRQAWQELPGESLWHAFLLTAVSYAVLVGYDYLAVRSIEHPLRFRKIAFGSFVGFAISYTLGALLGGTSVRYRMYSSWELSTVEIVRLLATVGITFWLGVFALGGVLFVVAPFDIPADLVAKTGLPNTIRPLGWILLALTAVYFAIAGLWRTPVTIQGHKIKLPGLGMSLLQVFVAALDFAVAAGCLYVLLPGDLPLSYSRFLAIYMLAWVAVVTTHAPGGVGVFDVVIVSLTHQSRKDAVLVALLVYRFIYYLIPFFFAVPMFLLHEATIPGSKVNRLVARLFGENALSGPLFVPPKPEEQAMLDSLPDQRTP